MELLAVLVALIEVHLACFSSRSVPYFEYIESAANWADEISRKGTQGNWAPIDAFSVEECGVAAELLTHFQALQ